MSELMLCGEREDLGGGRFRLTQHLRPIAYARNGVMRRMAWRYGDSGDVNMPRGADEAILARFDPRIAGKSPLWEVRTPDRSKFARFALLNANNVAAQKASDNEYVYPNALDGADLALIYAGHYVAADLRLKAGHPSIISWRMDAQAGFDPKTMMLGDMTIRQPVLLPPVGKETAASVPLEWAVSQDGGRYRLDCALPKGDWAGWTLDPTLMLQPDGTEGLDAYIRSDSPSTPRGGNEEQFIGWYLTWGSRMRFLIRFDLSALPPSAIISSTILTLTRRGSYASVPSTVRVYRLRRDWVESQVTWNSWKTGSAWSVPGATGELDCDATVIASLDRGVGDSGVHSWALSGTSKSALDFGYGWLLRPVVESGPNALYSYYPSENETPSRRPKLVIEYTVYVPSSHQMSGGLSRRLTGGMYE